MKISDSHLSPEDLIDVVDGARAEASVPHLATCETCRAQLTRLRAVMSLSRDADVPEPSPLFWAQFSGRVRRAIDVEPIARHRWFNWARPAVFVPVAIAVAVAAVVLAVVVNPIGRMSSRATPAISPTTVAATVVEDPAGDAADLDSDSSLSLVADLTAGIDLNAAIEAGLTSRDSAEHAITHLNADELRTLQRLLTEELARRGA